jgi:hypothetical protein
MQIKKKKKKKCMKQITYTRKLQQNCKDSEVKELDELHA